MADHIDIDIEGISVPTLEGLNFFHPTRVQLLLLRCLNTSDLTFHFALLSPPTIREIIRLSMRLFTSAEKEDELDFSPEECLEYFSYLANMGEYADANSAIHQHARRGKPN